METALFAPVKDEDAFYNLPDACYSELAPWIDPFTLEDIGAKNLILDKTPGIAIPGYDPDFHVISCEFVPLANQPRGSLGEIIMDGVIIGERTNELRNLKDRSRVFSFAPLYAANLKHFYEYGNECGVVLFDPFPNAPLVVCDDLFSLSAIRRNGMNVFYSIDESKSQMIPDRWLEYLIDDHRRYSEIIFAFENSEYKYAISRATAEELVHGGVPSSKIKRCQWQKKPIIGSHGTPLFKLANLPRFLNAAAAYKLDNPSRVFSMCDFLTANRPPLQFHIDGILPHLGKMTFSATSKFGKSMWAIQTGLCLASGDCSWLGWQFGNSARVLYLQAEISDSLLEARLKAILESMPENINRDRALLNFHIQEISAARPNLFTKEGRETAEKLIKIYKPSVLILDPLAAICPGLEENAAESMGAALNYFSEITRRFECAVILVHHHGKGGVSRGSSVFEAWAESDITAARVDNEPDVCRVDMRLRCVYNPGAKYWRMPSQDNLWFADMPDYVPEKKLGGRPAAVKDAHVVAALSTAKKPLSWTDLHEEVMRLANVKTSAASTIIKTALTNGTIKKVENLYVLP